MENGQYQEAYDIATNDKEYKSMKVEIQAEAMVIVGIQNLKNQLKNPESLQIIKIKVYNQGANCLLTYSAQNSFGGNTINYIYIQKNGSTNGNISATELEGNSINAITTRINLTGEGDTKIDLSRIKNIITSEKADNVQIIK